MINPNYTYRLERQSFSPWVLSPWHGSTQLCNDLFGRHILLSVEATLYSVIKFALSLLLHLPLVNYSNGAVRIEDRGDARARSCIVPPKGFAFTAPQRKDSLVGVEQ